MKVWIPNELKLPISVDIRRLCSLAACDCLPIRHLIRREGNIRLRKLAGPALTPEALGEFDYVLLSHDHHFVN